MAVSMILVVGVLIMRALLFEVYTRAPDFLETHLPGTLPLRLKSHLAV